MAARLTAVFPRLVVLTLVWLLATSTITFAASGRKATEKKPAAAPAKAAPTVLIVPDVRDQAYVFAKGMLEDAGFAWRVEGSVKGYAANTVAVQSPAPGTKVADTGAPIVVVRLARNPEYTERGLPENASPHDGTKLVLASEAAKAAKAAKPNGPKQKAQSAPAKNRKSKARGQKAASAERKPAFRVPGAPAEPLDEMPLPARARLLEKRVASHAKPSDQVLSYFRYQHAWIVTGARFGWSDGAEALRILVRVDRDIVARWGIGSSNLAGARAALAEVESKAGK